MAIIVRVKERHDLRDFFYACTYIPNYVGILRVHHAGQMALPAY